MANDLSKRARREAAAMCHMTIETSLPTWIQSYREPQQFFKYLGSTVNEQSTQEEEIKNRIAKYIQNVGCMCRLLKDRNVPKKAKQIIHQTILRPILIFVRECWTLTKRLEQKITTANMKVIRMIQGVTIWDRKRS